MDLPGLLELPLEFIRQRVNEPAEIVAKIVVEMVKQVAPLDEQSKAMLGQLAVGVLTGQGEQSV